MSLITNKYHRWSALLGTGLALVPMHNLWLLEHTAINGNATMFLPVFGYIICILASLFFLRDHWKEISFGPRIVYIPLVIITLSIAISGFINGASFNDKLSPLLMGTVMLGLYLVSRSLGAGIFHMLVPFVILSAVISLILGILHPGLPASDPQVAGLITNYCAGAGFLIFGAIVNQGRWQWLLCLIALIGLFYIGALEAVFIIGVVFIVLLVRWDFSQRMIITVGALLLFAGLWATLGHLMPLYTGNNNLSTLRGIISGSLPVNDDSLLTVTSGRWPIIIDSLNNIRAFGHGFALSTTGGHVVHNIPLIIMHQVGPLAAVCWLVVTIYCLVTTKWKYAWIAVLAMGVFDHYLWTQFLPYWWVLIGVSTTSTIKSDLIFRRRNEYLSAEPVL